MKEYSKGIYVKFKPEEVEILHNRMKEAGVQNMSAYIRKMALNGYVIIPKWPDLDQVISLHSRIKDIWKLGGEYREVLGYLPQDFGYYPDLTVYDSVSYTHLTLPTTPYV